MIAWLAMCPLSGEQTLYRYEAYEEGLRPSNVSPYQPEMTSLPELGEISRGSAEGPFKPSMYGEFRSVHAYAFTSFTGEGALSGDFSIEAFIRTVDGENGTVQVIFSSEPEGGGSGISLYLEDGYIIGRVWSGATIAEELVSADPLITGKWHRLVYTYDFDVAGNHGLHGIWIDEERVAAATIQGGTPRLASGLSPVVGAGRGEEGLSSGLQADVLSLQVHDYVLSEYYLTKRVIRDGSTYFGIVEYHNYLGLDDSGDMEGGIPMERRLVDTYFDSGSNTSYPELESILQDLWFLPFMNDGYVVQGMAGDPENNRLFLSMYHRTAAGTSYTYPSIVVEIKLPDGELGNVFILQEETGAPLDSHVGGCAYWDGMLFLPGPPRGQTLDPDLYVYDISQVEASTFNPETMEGFSELEFPATWKIRDPLSALGDGGGFNSLAFMGIHMNALGEVILHLGDFKSSSAAPVHLFELGSDPDGVPTLTFAATHIQSHKWAQAMHYYFEADVAKQRIWKSFLSTSYGSVDSHLYTNLNLPSRDDPISTVAVRMPAGLEETFAINNQLWLTSESGAIYFQKRSSPWTHLFPFMALIEIEEWVDLNDNRIIDQWEAKYGMNGPQDPHSDDDLDGYDLYTEYLWDTDPRSAEHSPAITTSWEPFGITLETSPARFYTLQGSTDAQAWENISLLPHRRGTGETTTFFDTVPESGSLYRVLIEID